MFKYLLLVLLLLIVLVQIDSFKQNLIGESVLYGLTSIVQTNENSTVCLKHLEDLKKAIESKHVWALKALDASGAPGNGFIYGNNLWIGSHAQCQDISNRRHFEVSYEKVKHAPPTPYDFPPYQMGYYMFFMKHNNTLQFHSQLPLEFIIQLGLCLPKSCTADDLQPLFVNYIETKSLNIQNLYDLNLNLTEVKPLKETGSWMLQLPKTILLISLTMIIIILSIIGTIYDVRRHNLMKNLITGHRNNLTTNKTNPTSVSEVELVATRSIEESTKPSKFGEIIKCFSIYTNTKSLMKTKLNGDTVRVIHGLRFLSMLWVVMVHSVFYQADFIENPGIAYRLSEDFFSQILSNSTYCVDTYLFLSGFLVAYLYLKSKSNSAANNPPESINYMRKVTEFFLMLLNRFLRLTPVYLFVILLTDVLYTYFRQSSALITSELNDERCGKYWWRNLLYINNLYPRSEMCLSWSWYLSLDTQFFVITAFLLILSTIAVKLAGFLTILLILTTIIVTIYKSYSIGYIPSMDEQLAQLDAIYDLPWNRLGPYLIGVITAYLLLIKLKKQLILQERVRILLWILFPILNLWILFTIYGRDISVEFSAFYMGTSRTLWGIGMAWLLIACSTGNARALENFLSFRGWIPLSRLTYCAYLINPTLTTTIFLSSDHSSNTSIASISLVAHGIILISFLFAYVLYVLIEAPLVLLTKLFFENLVMGKKKTTTTTTPTPTAATSTTTINNDNN